MTVAPKTKKIAALPNDPRIPAAFTKAQALAVKSLVTGTANPEQQKRALDWIITRAAATYEETFFGERVHDSSFAQGKRFVGNQIVGLLNTDVSTLKE